MGRGSEPQRAEPFSAWDLLFPLQKPCVLLLDDDGWWKV